MHDSPAVFAYFNAVFEPHVKAYDKLNNNSNSVLNLREKQSASPKVKALSLGGG